MNTKMDSNTRIQPIIVSCLLWVAVMIHTDHSHAESNIDLPSLSLEALMKIKISSVAKKSQPLSHSAAAIYVITHEDIQKMGYTTIPDALRVVPGLHVAQIDANKWAITARGFNDRFANKLLVLMDGRTLYTPLYSGVYWDVQDTVMEDIERIEVIRGPGGTLWGANAVNGVINIITRQANQTTDGLAAVNIGNQEKSVTIRQGNKFSETLDGRAYAKFFDRNNFVNAQNNESPDTWDMRLAGFRFDWQQSASDALTFQGDIYQSHASQVVNLTTLTPPGNTQALDNYTSSGTNLMFKWHETLSNQSERSIKLYYDQTERDEIVLASEIKTFDVEAQHRFPINQQHELTWGIGYRHVSDQLEDSFTVQFSDDRISTEKFSLFAQDEIKISKDYTLTIGSKFEHNDYSGFEAQPSMRMLWQASDKDSVWGAVSRAVRTPSRSHSDIQINVTAQPGPPVPKLISIIGNKAYDAEDLIAWEIGYRGQPREKTTLDITGFYHLYQHLSSREPSTPTIVTTPSPTHIHISRILQNGMKGESYGIEVTSGWQAAKNWRLNAGATWLKLNLTARSNSNDTSTEKDTEGKNPEYQYHLRSQLNLSSKLTWNTAFYYVDEITTYQVPAYTRVDTVLEWRYSSEIEVSFVGNNIFNQHHKEYSTQGVVVASEVPRSFYARVKWLY